MSSRILRGSERFAFQTPEDELPPTEGPGVASRTNRRRFATPLPVAPAGDGPGTTTRVRRSVGGKIVEPITGQPPIAMPKGVQVVCLHCQRMFSALAPHGCGHVLCVHCGATQVINLPPSAHR